MKKIFYFIAALVLVSAVSCVKEEAPVAPSTDSMTVTLGFDGGTKATLSDKWGISWNEGLELKWDGGSYTIKATDIVDNTVTFVAQGLEVGETITSYSPVYESYTQNNPGSTNWTKLFLTGIACEEGKITTMQIAGSILRFIPYTEDYPTESVKSVTFESGETSYTVTITNPVSLGAYSYINDKGNEVNVQAANSKENALGRGIYLPLAPATYDSFKVTVRTVSGAKYTFVSGAGKKLTLEENSVVNMSLPLDGHLDESVVVTFNTNGGSFVNPVTLNKGESVSAPTEIPTKSGAVPAGLYAGQIDPENTPLTFAGWFSDETLETEYDFSAPVNSDITLYAKYNAPASIDISSLSGGNLLAKTKTYLNSLTLDTVTKYTLVLSSDAWSSFRLNNENVELYLVGVGKKVGIQSNWSDQTLKVSKGHVYLGKNFFVKIAGSGTPALDTHLAPIVLDEKGKLTLLTGSSISDCNINSIYKEGAWPETARALIYVNGDNCVFTLDGGEVANNKVHQTYADFMTGILCNNNGKVLIKSGKFANNSVICDVAGIAVCGGVYAPDTMEITKTGGVIENNTATITAQEGNVNHVGQQILYRSVSQKNKGVYKIDSNLTVTDNFSTSDLTNALWKSLVY